MVAACRRTAAYSVEEAAAVAVGGAAVDSEVAEVGMVMAVVARVAVVDLEARVAG